MNMTYTNLLVFPTLPTIQIIELISIALQNFVNGDDKVIDGKKKWQKNIFRYLINIEHDGFSCSKPLYGSLSISLSYLIIRFLCT